VATVATYVREVANPLVVAALHEESCEQIGSAHTGRMDTSRLTPVKTRKEKERKGDEAPKKRKDPAVAGPSW
jgi:hypothetical protein